MARTPDDLARTEVYASVDSLIPVLAAGAYVETEGWLKHDHGARAAIHNLFAEAAELAAPVDDWEEAAIQEGASKGPDGFWRIGKDDGIFKTAESLCADHGIDPIPREVYEFWIVSEWLAEKLEAKGEKVTHDFAGLTIWARTTTGQSIAIDSVIEAIAADLNREG